MTTLHTPRLTDFSLEDRAILERMAKRMGRTPEAVLEPSIMGVQTHWPAWLEANHAETSQSYRIQGKLTPIAKEAIHVAVSITNHCSY
jgi:alkylhydroperoxidase family enzyme